MKIVITKQDLSFPRNFQQFQNIQIRAYLQSWEVLRIIRNSQKTGNSVNKGYAHICIQNLPLTRISFNSFPLQCAYRGGSIKTVLN